MTQITQFGFLLTCQMLPILWTDNIAKNMGKNAALAQNKIFVLLILPSIILTKSGRSQQDGRFPRIIFYSVSPLCMLDLWRISYVTYMILNLCCWAAEGNGWCRHADSCNSGNEQALPHSLDYPSSWARSVSTSNLQENPLLVIKMLFCP